MTCIITINAADPEHLSAVKTEMVERGAPTLRAIRDEAQGVIVALEGSHRFVAALELGLTPTLALVDEDEMLTCADLGFDDCGWFDGEPARAADIRDRIAAPCGTYKGCAFHRVDDDAIAIVA
ncbi:Uncharacterised protein [Starkeya nomas]|uniref:ParB/Sulfiredoxin domain-containing protein n=1 Tax=Starkeya nomas TaxID=2666134 RepID=A0A5S9R507_9HYPH|nr:hypothetical protein [Starkeya nomas]CAA0130292.1 Uncharacterised protein [Starkeya nomas]